MLSARADVNHDGSHAGPGTRELLACAPGAREEAADARVATAGAWAATSGFVSRFVYTACYTISYGLVFSTTLLAHAIPANNAAVRGLIDGAHAAVQQVDLLQGAALDSPAAVMSKALAPA
jgi:hypothetical protein